MEQDTETVSVHRIETLRFRFSPEPQGEPIVAVVHDHEGDESQIFQIKVKRLA